MRSFLKIQVERKVSGVKVAGTWCLNRHQTDFTWPAIRLVKEEGGPLT